MKVSSGSGSPPSSAALRTSKVLVIDDDLDFGELTQRRLIRMGFEAKLHGGSRGAMEPLLRDHFDLVILDVNMPGLAGPDVIKMIRTLRDGEIKVMFYSSSDSHELRQLSEKHGADGYLSKGSTTAEFQHRVRDLVRAAQSVRGPESKSR
jgi:two-component system copper resistance phosphate regulon response regulator CusR